MAHNFFEQLIENIPRAIDSSCLGSGRLFRDGHAMVVSPGPSLLLSLKNKKIADSTESRWSDQFDYGIIPDFIMVDARNT